MSRYNRYIEEEEKAGFATFDGPYRMLSDCLLCRHYEGDWCCEAFSDGFPPEIWNLMELYRTTVCNEENGMKYEKKGKQEFYLNQKACRQKIKP